MATKIRHFGSPIGSILTAWHHSKLQCYNFYNATKLL